MQYGRLATTSAELMKVEEEGAAEMADQHGQMYSCRARAGEEDLREVTTTPAHPGVSRAVRRCFGMDPPGDGNAG